ncbi:hypothetical protein [Mesobacillus foraminis]|uniref:hypothetical protein n=1 Tax=Mesobacillus foraminis TaxID=279826 RepID=UPI0013CE8C98|nr:hypothetical protein [Mesobacillus foraminis]
MGGERLHALSAGETDAIFNCFCTEGMQQGEKDDSEQKGVSMNDKAQNKSQSIGVPAEGAAALGRNRHVKYR